MLLPSAVSCTGPVDQNNPRHARPQRPSLPSFGAYQPHDGASGRASPLSSSCRALQSILGATATVQYTHIHQPARIHQTARKLENPFVMSTKPISSRALRKSPPRRGANKRRRSVFELDNDVQMHDAQNTPRQVHTPKRRRRIPLAMPLGLSADDFRALEHSADEEKIDIPAISPRHNHSDHDSAYGASPTTEDVEWTTDDDRLLVETVLEKLKLSKRDWNDCARRLGKDKDSLGKRWTVLIGEGNVGLRRGGRISRPSLDISSW